MKEQIDPKLYQLPPRTVLMKRGPDEFILVINRKSRIIMKDALTILKRAEKIKEKALRNLRHSKRSFKLKAYLG